jgi:hypothetical protein
MKSQTRVKDAKLNAFDQHKEELLDTLRNAYKRGPKSEPFDANKAWVHLSSLARYYFHRDWSKHGATRPADRRAQLETLAKTLRQARDAIDGAMQSDIANDLISAWWDTDPSTARALFGANGQLSNFVDLHIFKKTGALLAALEAVALRATDAVPKRQGRPRGTANLPLDFIGTLAFIYRQSTHLKPGAGGGPFSRLVLTFLAAIGRRYEPESVIDDIKATRTSAQNSNWSSSPFDDTFDE